jgi:hypothetical protein
MTKLPNITKVTKVKKEGKVVPVLNLIKDYAMKAYGGVDVYIHIFLTLALAGGKRSASHPDHFTPRGRAPSTQWIGTRASLDNMWRRENS